MDQSNPDKHAADRELQSKVAELCQGRPIAEVINLIGMLLKNSVADMPQALRQAVAQEFMAVIFEVPVMIRHVDATAVKSLMQEVVQEVEQELAKAGFETGKPSGTVH